MGSTETKLSRLTQTKADIKNAIINKGVAIEDETPFKDYAAKIGEIKESAFKYLNIFCQEAEPEVKDGVWIKGERAFSSVKVTDTVSADPFWESTNASKLPYSTGDYANMRTTIGADVYIYQSSNSYRYNVETGDYEELTLPTGFTIKGCCAYNNDVYLFGSTVSYKYNTITKSYTQLSNASPTFSYNLNATLVGKYIYIFVAVVTGKSPVYRYNIEADTYTQLPNMPHSNGGRYGVVSIGDKIYIVGNDNSTSADGTPCNTMYEYNTLTNIYTKLTDMTHYFKSSQSQLCNIGTDIYYFGSAESGYEKKAYKYDTVSQTHTELEDIPYSFKGGVVAYYNNKIYLIGGVSYTKYLSVLAFPILDFKDNSVVIQSGNTYRTHFITLPEVVDGRLETPFTDAFHYTDETGLNGTLPTYYGDGTQWNKFKN